MDPLKKPNLMTRDKKGWEREWAGERMWRGDGREGRGEEAWKVIAMVYLFAL